MTNCWEMKNLLLRLFFLIIPIAFANAEIIDGPANVRDKPNGDIAYSLEDDQYVYAYEPINNWFKITVTAIIRVEDLKNDSLISKDAILYDYDFQTPKGVTKSVLNISGYTTETEDENFIEVMLFGYTFKNNIKVSSILEREIERTINNSLFEELTELKKKFDFYEHKVGEYIVWTTYDWEVPWGSADFRMMIYFNSERQIIGVANKGRKLTLRNKSESTIDRNYRIQYLVDMNKEDQKNFSEAMTRAFAGRD